MTDASHTPCSKPSHFETVYRATGLKRVDEIRRGLPSSELERTRQAMRLPKARFYQMLRFPTSTMRRKLAHKALLTPEQSERVLGLQRLIGQVEVMMAESGVNPESIVAAELLGKWLDAPLPALAQ